ncbi:hypothetical protein HY251_13830 [bacterium]|nr:hypothetical protein [bacterium]
MSAGISGVEREESGELGSREVESDAEGDRLIEREGGLVELASPAPVGGDADESERALLARARASEGALALAAGLVLARSLLRHGSPSFLH